MDCFTKLKRPVIVLALGSFWPVSSACPLKISANFPAISGLWTLPCVSFVFWYKMAFLHTSSHIFHLGKREIKSAFRTSLVVQWLRICLPMQGTRVRALVREDPTCHGATNPMHHNCWACALEPASYNYWAHVPQLLKPMRLEPVLRNKKSHRNEKPAHCNEE